ncbi:tyrosine-type recombinase/integrase [Acuticoccus sp. MNP-M23]|uniref:tyrosine-type recombinase/integrase n=1 Tax=Acuticoccus sp. MNP-M23 TaxID=3072793 RepID=UPI0028154D5C|nr:tyrosine-type recombinase/integrase [Acuticoccus sp. MNP-M23]WMS40820.1 tyrosine-type recombinase/integrase [Acuticoccus sp. MNP-M23]
MAARDRRYLELHGGSWRVAVNVPRDLKDHLGSKVKRPLRTDSLEEANRLKGPIVSEILTLFQATRKGIGQQAFDAKQTAREDALALKAWVDEAVDDDDEHEIRSLVVSDHVDAILGQPIGTDRHGDPIYPEDRDQRARTVHAIAAMGLIPIDSLLADYHAQRGDYKARTKLDDVRAIKYLTEWCERNNVVPTISHIDRRTAGRFIGDLPALAASAQKEAGTRISNRTCNKYISRLSSYWMWLVNRGQAKANIWRGQSLKEETRREGQVERPFTDAEISKLLSGAPARGSLLPLMKIAALTGARIDAIVQLKVSDVEGGCFRFRPQKKERSSRLVPIHSSLEAIVEELVKGKTPVQDLFTKPDGSPEYPELEPGDPRERSMPAVKAFTHYRRKVGVDEQLPGRRRSLVNFHSFRRWFATKAEEAGQPLHIIESVTGHTRQGTLADRYSKGPSLEQRRACVEAVRLP